MRRSAHRYTKKFSALLVLPLAAVLALSACSDDDTMSEDVNITPKEDGATVEDIPASTEGPHETDTSDEVTETSFVIEQGGMKTTMTYTAKGDRVTQQSTVNEIDYAAAGLASAEEAQEVLDPVVEGSQGVEGLEHSIDYRQDDATESMSVDYEVVSLSDLAEVPGYEMSTEDVNDDTYISLNVSREELLNAGFEEMQ